MNQNFEVSCSYPQSLSIIIALQTPSLHAFLGQFPPLILSCPLISFSNYDLSRKFLLEWI